MNLCLHARNVDFANSFGVRVARRPIVLHVTISAWRHPSLELKAATARLTPESGRELLSVLETETEETVNNAATRLFKFCLKINRDSISNELSDALYEAGCGDAIVSELGGQVRLSFAREATDNTSAVMSAVMDIQAAGCDVVGVALT